MESRDASGAGIMFKRLVIDPLRPAMGYPLALGLTAVALLLRFVVPFPPGFPYLTFFPAVILTAVVAGMGPAMLCAVLSGLAAWYFFIPPYETFSLAGATPVALGFYVFVVAIDIALIHGLSLALRDGAKNEDRANDLARRRELLFQELQHRVSNNLQVVSALLRLEERRVDDDRARHALAQAGGRLALIGSIQRKLINSEGEPEAFAAFALDMCREAILAAGAEGVVVEVRPEAPGLHPDQAAPVSLVMLECVNNALEHAFDGGRPGRIDVSLTRDDDEITLRVADNGRGPPPGFDVAGSDSLGLSIALAMARQLGGRFSIEAENGAVCRLVFPVRV